MYSVRFLWLCLYLYISWIIAPVLIDTPWTHWIQGQLLQQQICGRIQPINLLTTDININTYAGLHTLLILTQSNHENTLILLYGCLLLNQRMCIICTYEIFPMKWDRVHLDVQVKVLVDQSEVASCKSASSGSDAYVTCCRSETCNNVARL